MRVLAVAAALTLAVAAPAAGAPPPGSARCPLFPADNVGHADVSRPPVHPRSGARVARRSRRLQDQHRPPHRGGAPGPDGKADAPPDPDPTPSRRR
jgi:hypothetical protein